MSGTSKHRVVTASFTRPANADQYTAGDGVSDDATTPTVLTFSKVASFEAGGGVIKGITFHKSDQDLTTAAFNVYFFDTAPAAAGFNDNAAIAITDAEWATCIGGVAILAANGASVVTGDIWTETNLDLPYQAATGTRDIYGVVVAADTYTPASGEVFTIRLLVESD